MRNQTERRIPERNYYVDGNTVRRMEAAPDYRRIRKEKSSGKKRRSFAEENVRQGAIRSVRFE